MLLIIVGAGASYDSCTRILPTHHRNSRPPLANELFGDRPEFLDTVLLYPDTRPLIPLLRDPTAEESVESKLQELAEAAVDYPIRYTELTAIRYYIRTVIGICERNWQTETRGITNQRSLFADVNEWQYKTNDCVLIVTFNYDLLIEKALEEMDIPIHTPIFDAKYDDTALLNYVNNPHYKLFKLHGSINWGHFVNVNQVDKNTEQIEQMRVNIECAASQSLSPQFAMLPQLGNLSYVGHIDGRVAIPAIAIPLKSKTEFECPAQHIEVLCESLPKVDKILIVGWRASENHFLKLVVEHIRATPRVMVVCNGQEDCDQTIGNLKDAGLKGRSYETFDLGFSAFIEKRRALSWLREVHANRP